MTYVKYKNNKISINEKRKSRKEKITDNGNEKQKFLKSSRIRKMYKSRKQTRIKLKRSEEKKIKIFLEKNDGTCSLKKRTKKVLTKIFAINLDYLDLGYCQSLQLICIRYDDNPNREKSEKRIRKKMHENFSEKLFGSLFLLVPSSRTSHSVSSLSLLRHFWLFRFAFLILLSFSFFPLCLASALHFHHVFFLNIFCFLMSTFRPKNTENSFDENTKCFIYLLYLGGCLNVCMYYSISS